MVRWIGQRCRPPTEPLAAMVESKWTTACVVRKRGMPEVECAVTARSLIRVKKACAHCPSTHWAACGVWLLTIMVRGGRLARLLSVGWANEKDEKADDGRKQNETDQSK